MSSMSYAIHKRRYADPSPYPEISIQKPNPQYAKLLMEAYAGAVSEFTVINQYLFHYFSFKSIDKELGELLENISFTEMLHLEMLADTIRKLGGNPAVKGSCNTHGSCRNGCFIFYHYQLCERLKADLESEYKAIEDYRRLIELIDDNNVKAVLERIIRDEEVHAELFREAIQKYCGRIK